MSIQSSLNQLFLSAMGSGFAISQKIAKGKKPEPELGEGSSAYSGNGSNDRKKRKTSGVKEFAKKRKASAIEEKVLESLTTELDRKRIAKSAETERREAIAKAMSQNI